jgi:FkbM family methyltransferase
MPMNSGAVAIMNHLPGFLATSFRSHTVAARILRPLVNRVVPDVPTPIVVRSGAAKGIRLLIYPRHEKYYWSGTHEEAVQQAVADILKPGATFWDIGAHIGFFSLLASRLVGDAGRVHAFEPMTENRKRLLAAVELNQGNNLTVHAVAVAGASGEAVLHAHLSTTMWTLVPKREETAGITVPCSTLDEMAQSLASPDLIKIDVEGAEVSVLRGGSEFLQRARPPLIVEFSDEITFAEARSLLPFYTFSPISATHWVLHA